MSYISGENRGQLALLPAAIEDYVAADAPVRVIDAFVNGVAKGLGFGRAVPAVMGRPPYDPRDLVKPYLYGYLNEIRSSRRLERECSRNLEVMWLLRRLAPDFKTIADFRRDNGAARQCCFRNSTDQFSHSRAKESRFQSRISVDFKWGNASPVSGLCSNALPATWGASHEKRHRESSA
jgi:transposase